MRTLTWAWSQENYNIKIYDGKKPIGRIPKFVDKAIATINGKKFFYDTPRRMYREFVSDPTDSNKAYCEIDYLESSRFKVSCPAFEYYAEQISSWPFKRKWFMSNKGMRLVELEIPGGFFKTKGTIRIYQEENFELVIYCLFYFNTCYDPGL